MTLPRITQHEKRTKCTLYDARAEHARKTYSNTALNEFLSAVSSIDQQIHATTVLNVDETRVTDTQYGKRPVGSLLSIQCPLMPPDFKGYFNVPDGNDADQSYQLVYPQFPIVEV